MNLFAQRAAAAGGAAVDATSGSLLAFRADGISRLCLGVEFQRAGDEVRCAEFVAV